jgi:hypothetical protein
VEQESLVRRGFGPDDLVENLEPVGHEKVSKLMATNRLQLIF